MEFPTRWLLWIALIAFQMFNLTFGASLTYEDQVPETGKANDFNNLDSPTYQRYGPSERRFDPPSDRKRNLYTSKVYFGEPKHHGIPRKYWSTRRKNQWNFQPLKTQYIIKPEQSYPLPPGHTDPFDLKLDVDGFQVNVISSKLKSFGDNSEENNAQGVSEVGHEIEIMPRAGVDGTKKENDIAFVENQGTSSLKIKSAHQSGVNLPSENQHTILQNVNNANLPGLLSLENQGTGGSQKKENERTNEESENQGTSSENHISADLSSPKLSDLSEAIVPESESLKKKPESLSISIKETEDTVTVEEKDIDPRNFEEGSGDLDDPGAIQADSPSSGFVESAMVSGDKKEFQNLQEEIGDGFDKKTEEADLTKSARLVEVFRRSHDAPSSCKTPTGEAGHCRRLTECLLSDALSNFSLFLQYLCLMRGPFVGICCPDNPVIEISDGDNTTVSTTQEFKQPEEGCGENANMRIVGGTMSLPHEWTWMVALMRRNRFYCGGVIINDWYILTAAHCVLGIKVKDLTVRLGEYNFLEKSEHQDDIPIAEIKRHAQFVTLTFQHDIALLKAKRKIEYSKFVGSICLPEREGRDFSEVNATVVGWGTVSFGGAASPILRQVTIPVWSNEDCDKTYLLESINDSFMCAGSPENGEDACQGDSGGPLMALNNQGRWEVIGIVSWGRRCGDPTYPGVYTRVTTYMDWIKENIQ